MTFKGRGKVDVGETSQEIEPGTLVYFPPGVPHRLSAHGGPLDYFEIQAWRSFKTTILSKEAASGLKWFYDRGEPECGARGVEPELARRRRFLSLESRARLCLPAAGASGLAVLEQTREPEVGELLLHRVLAQARAQVVEVDAVELLVLVEAGEDDGLLAASRDRRACCRHCAQTSFIMHCIGELIEPIADVLGLQVRLRARRAAPP